MKSIQSSVKRRAVWPHVRAERRVGRASSAGGPRSTLVHVQRLVHELQVHQVELELQNAELRAARDDLEASVKRYAELFEFAPIGYATLDQHLRLCELNPAAAKLLGQARATLNGTALSLAVTVEDMSRLEVTLARARNTGTQQHVDVTLHSGAPVSVSATALYDGQILVALESVASLGQSMDVSTK